ncbi:MAG: hypothetical protein GY827_02525 [Cytophagales bacterium]|nr:hypothetical protein [Cytophagales bacterium]
MKQIITFFILCSTLSAFSQNKLIEKGEWYKLLKIGACNKVLCTNNGKENKTPLYLNGKYEKEVQNNKDIILWQFIDKGNGYYHVQNKDSKLFLSSTKDSTIIQVKQPTNYSLWEITKEYKSLIFLNKQLKMYLGIKDKTKNASIILTKWAAAWKPIKVGEVEIKENTSYELYNSFLKAHLIANTDNTKAIVKAKPRVMIYHAGANSSNKESKHWVFTLVDKQYYYIQNKASNKYLNKDFTLVDEPSETTKWKLYKNDEEKMSLQNIDKQFLTFKNRSIIADKYFGSKTQFTPVIVNTKE